MATNYSIGLDLQGLVKKVYKTLQYESSFYKMLNDAYIGEVRNTGTPMIEVLNSNALTINVRQTEEIANALTPSLATYTPVKVDLTELPMDYSVRVPVLVMGSGVENAIADAIDQKNSAVAKAIDTYGFGKLATDVVGEGLWAPQDQAGYITALNNLKATLFNKNVYDGYRLGLSATEYANLVSALTSILKYETMAGVEGVDRGIVANAYGIEIFPINDNYLSGEIGYFFNPIAVVGDTFFDSFVQYNGNYPGFPGYFVIEGNIMFGAEVVKQDAIVKLVETLSA